MEDLWREHHRRQHQDGEKSRSAEPQPSQRVGDDCGAHNGANGGDGADDDAVEHQPADIGDSEEAPEIDNGRVLRYEPIRLPRSSPPASAGPRRLHTATARRL